MQHAGSAVPPPHCAPTPIRPRRPALRPRAALLFPRTRSAPAACLLQVPGSHWGGCLVLIWGHPNVPAHRQLWEGESARQYQRSHAWGDDWGLWHPFQGFSVCSCVGVCRIRRCVHPAVLPLGLGGGWCAAGCGGLVGDGHRTGGRGGGLLLARAMTGAPRRTGYLPRPPAA